MLVGAEEFSLHEADALIDALTQLVDRGRRGKSLARRSLEGALAVLDPELAQDAETCTRTVVGDTKSRCADLVGGEPFPSSSMTSHSRALSLAGGRGPAHEARRWRARGTPP